MNFSHRFFPDMDCGHGNTRDKDISLTVLDAQIRHNRKISRGHE